MVKKISPNSGDGKVTYVGPSARGLLAEKILQPSGKVSETFSGSFSEIAGKLISEYSLTDIFAVDPELDDFQIAAYTVDGYEDLYEVFRGMTAEFDKALRFRWAPEDSGAKCYISAEQISDFTEYIKYGAAECSSFTITLDYSGTNHVIAKSTDDDGNIYVIHVFADAGGGIQPYATAAVPVYDSDYILTEENKIMKGIEEVVELLEEDNDPTTNYVLQTSQPDDWSSNAEAYYVIETTEDEDTGEITENYAAVEMTTETTYALLTSEPDGWSTDYGSYYVQDDTTDSGYSSVSGTETTTYVRIYNKPSDWKTTYSEYYYYYFDGVEESYESVSGVSYSKYKLQTAKPSDWRSNYDSYYCRKTKKVKKNGKTTTKTTWEAVTKALMRKGWKKNKFYTKYSKTRAPAWDTSLKYYQETTTTTAPTWSSSKYFEATEVSVAPTWAAGTYYTAVLDHYASLVEAAIEVLEESGPSESAEMTLQELDVRIGDIVGAYDEVTGMEITEPITNIIYKNESGSITIDYTIGGESGTDDA